MKKYLSLIAVLFLTNSFVFGQKSDSLVLMKTFRYQSKFEKQSFYNFIVNKKDTLDLFLSIENNISPAKINLIGNEFNDYVNELITSTSKIRNIKRKIKEIYRKTHDKYLRKYDERVFLPELFRTGTYNCVTASILYAMIFERMHIPYKVMASTNHVFLIANPGKKSVVIETTNPGLEDMVFNGQFKKQYVDNLRNSKLISEGEYRSKSTEEIFEEKFKEVKDAKFENLFGFQYYNLGLNEFQKNNFASSADLLQKSYYFYPDIQVRVMLRNALLYEIQKSNFDHVSDIDYIGQLARFDDTDTNLPLTMFGNVVNNMLQYNNKELYCDSLYNRIKIFLTNKKMRDEFDFSFNMIMAYKYQNNEKSFKYALNALNIKPNYNDANLIFMRRLARKLDNMYNPQAELDSIKSYQKQFNFEQVKSFLAKNELVVYLRIAKADFDKNKLLSGKKYMQLFEDKCKAPIEDTNIRFEAEKAFYAYSTYYYRKHNRSQRMKIIKQGLEYIPNSFMLKVAQ